MLKLKGKKKSSAVTFFFLFLRYTGLREKLLVLSLPLLLCTLFATCTFNFLLKQLKWKKSLALALALIEGHT